jgi:hypothetical protein
MKLSTSLTTSLAVTAVAASASFAALASEETAMNASAGVAKTVISASAGVANMYLWRGYDLGAGEGNAAVFGDITASVGGFYGSIWASSGDSTAGTEYDVIAGYSGESGDFSYGLAIVSYVYPTDPLDTDIGDYVEAILTLGYGPVSFSYYDNIESEPGTYAPGEDYSYFTISAEFGSFAALIGRHDPDDGVSGPGAGNPTHLDLTYNYNENLSFTISKLIADDDSPFNVTDGDAHFVVSYTLPIE